MHASTPPRPTTTRNPRAWMLVGFAIVVLAIALTLYRSSRLVCSIAAFLLAIVFVWKVGFFIDRARIRRRFVLIAVASLAILLVGLTWYFTSSRSLFRNYVADPIPPSVQIRHSVYEGGIDPAAYLYFEMNPSDLDAILRGRPYVDKPAVHGPTHARFEWWRPESLSNPAVYYWEEHGPDDSIRNAAWLWVDETKSKAYFAYLNF